MRVNRLALFTTLLLSACKDDTVEYIDSPFDGGTADGGEDVRRDDCDVPVAQDALVGFLRAGEYKSWKRESAVHGSAGPHFGDVLTYVNDTLHDSLEAGDETHPPCAASVKELYFDGSEVRGWAVYVKVREHSYDGAGFYWFETTSTAENAAPDYQGDGVALCANCHRGGRDYVLTPFPLQ